MKRILVFLICLLLLTGCQTKPPVFNVRNTPDPHSQIAEKSTAEQSAAVPADSVNDLNEEYVMVSYTLNDSEQINAMINSGTVPTDYNGNIPDSVGVTTYNVIDIHPFTITVIDQHFNSSVLANGYLTRGCTIEDPELICDLFESGEVSWELADTPYPDAIKLEYRIIPE